MSDTEECGDVIKSFADIPRRETETPKSLAELCAAKVSECA